MKSTNSAIQKEPDILIEINIKDKNDIETKYEINSETFRVIECAILHNQGIINLCSEKEIIISLINAGIVVRKNDLLLISEIMQDIFKYILRYKSETGNIFLSDSAEYKTITWFSLGLKLK